MGINSLEERKKRMSRISNFQVDTIVLDPLMTAIPIETEQLNKLKQAAMIYISKAFDFTLDSFRETDFMVKLENSKEYDINITPNGAVVPKKEFILEYNIFLREWFECFRPIFLSSEGFINRVRLTPNLRIKFADDPVKNARRPLNTSLPHSDAWLEGPYSYNCHVPLFGDFENNYLKFFVLKDPNFFREEFLANAATYNEMQWVMEYYVDAKFKPVPDAINISDYALLHKTHRNPGSKTRISIDTTVVTDTFPVHPDRECEYSDQIPQLGIDQFVITTKSTTDTFYTQKLSTFSHYTTGAIQFKKLSA